MKKLFTITTILLCVLLSKAQNPIPIDSNAAITQSVGNAPTTKVLTNLLQVKKGLINATFLDTIQANTFATGYRIKYFPGAQIFTTSDNKFWIRDNAAKKWIAANSEGAGSITQINDSTVVICYTDGSCDTISLGNSNTFYFIGGDTIVTCDTVQSICVGDSCYQQQVCDTIALDEPIPTTYYQNGLWVNDNTVEHGYPTDNNSPGQLIRNTFLWTDFNTYKINGRPQFAPPVTIENSGWSQSSSSVIAFNHQGGSPMYYPNMIDNYNRVDLRLNYINRFATPTTGDYVGDTIGTMYDRIGYSWMTNSAPYWLSYQIDNVLAKQVGVMFHTLDTENTDAVTIFGQQVPAQYTLDDSTLLSKRIAVFKTDGTIQAPYYPDTRNDGTALMAFYPDANGNIKLGPVSGGGSITIINDTTIAICSFGYFLCDTFITVTIGPIQYVTIINDTTLQVCDSTGACETIDVGGSSPGVDRAFFEPSQVQTANTYHQTGFFNFSVGSGLTTGGVKNMNFLVSNTVTGNENVVFGRNMVVAGNTNFVAATDGQVFNTANYSSTFGDATINRGVSALTAGFGNKNWAESGFTMGSNNVNGSLNPTVGTANLYSNSTVIGLQNFSLGSVNTVIGYDLTANSASGYITQFGKSYTVTTPNSFNVGYTTNAFEITQNKVRINAARFEEYGGTTTAAANDLTLPNDGNRFTISGATQINTITTTNWQDGSKVWFIFSGAPLIKNNTAGTGATILLAGRVDFQAAAGDILYLGYNGTNWYEINRALAASTGGGSVTGFEFTDGSGFDGTVLNPTTLPTLSLTTTLTQGSVFFAGALGALAEDNTNLFFDNSNNILGVGINSGFTATRLNVVDNSLAGANMVNLTSTSTLASGGLQRMLNISLSGANVNASQNTFGIYSVNSHSGTTPVNVAVYGEVQNGTTSSAGIKGVADNQRAVWGDAQSGTGVTGNATSGNGGSFSATNGNGVVVGTTSGTGLTVSSDSGLPLFLSQAPTSTNTIVEIARISRIVNGSAANGVGGAINFYNEDASAVALFSSQISSRWTDVTNLSRTSTLNFQAVFSASTVDVLTLAGDGSVKLRPITATAASAITPTEGMLLIVSDTNGTFTSTGFWGYSGGAWGKLTN